PQLAKKFLGLESNVVRPMSPHPGPAPHEVKLLLKSLWEAGYSLRLEPSGTPGQWFILPIGNPQLPKEK
ncbi:MAG: hypothetical protein ACUVQH_10935, partial [Thermogutta sp.]